MSEGRPVVWKGEVLPEWIDHNGHMNAGYYLVVFDTATGPWTARCGFDDAYRRDHPFSTFSLEGHLTWERELLPGAPIRVEAQLLGYDDKKIHSFLRLVHDEEGFVASSHELLSIQVDLRTRRSAPFDETIRGRLSALLEDHRRFGVPAAVGRSISTKDGRS